MIRMTHPDVDGVGYAVNEQVFASVWSPLGWSQLEGGEAEIHASERLGRPVQNLDELKVEDLATMLAARGYKAPKGAKKPDLVAALQAAARGEGETLDAVPTPGFQPGVVDPNSADTTGLPAENLES